MKVVWAACIALQAMGYWGVAEAGEIDRSKPFGYGIESTGGPDMRYTVLSGTVAGVCGALPNGPHRFCAQSIWGYNRCQLLPSLGTPCEGSDGLGEDIEPICNRPTNEHPE